VMPEDGGDCDAMLARIASAGVDIGALALKLQRDGAQAFVKSWNELLKRIADKAHGLKTGRVA
jgi:transaldolase